MNKTVVRIAYTGSLVDDGTMDVKALAPALLAFGQLIEDANRIINGTSAKVQVLVRADVQHGSFDIGFDLAYSGLQQIKMMMGMAETSGLKALLEALSLTGGTAVGIMGLVEFVKWLRGRKIKNVTQIESGNFKMTVSDGHEAEIQEINSNVIGLYRSIKVRRSLDDMLRPLEKEGVDSFEVRNPKHKKDDKPIVVVNRNERIFFEAPQTEDDKKIDDIETERDMLLKIIGVQFEEQLKWRLTDGESSIYATIVDDDFLRSIEDRTITFGKGDMLKVRLRTRQVATAKGIKTENDIIKVIEKLSRPEQISLIDE